jgi:hypothetical protein
MSFARFFERFRRSPSIDKKTDTPRKLAKPSSIILAGEVASQNSEFKCRICMDLDDLEAEMCVPCECIGSIKYIHVSCLKEWIKEKKSIKCELCGQAYTNRWKMWAFKNKVIKSDTTTLSVFEKFMIFLKAVMIIYFQVIVVYSMLIFNTSTKGIRFKDMSLFRRIYLWLIFGGMVCGILCPFMIFFASKSYRKKVEEHVRALFPHSNEGEYAKQ